MKIEVLKITHGELPYVSRFSGESEGRVRSIRFVMIFFSAMALYGLMVQISQGMVPTDVPSICTNADQPVQQ